MSLYHLCYIVHECVHAKLLQSCLTLCDPHGLQPTRFLCPWDSLGKNPAGGCHALLQGIFPTLGSNLPLQRLLHGQVGSSPLSHQGTSSYNTQCDQCYEIVVKVQQIQVLLWGTFLHSFSQIFPIQVSTLKMHTPQIPRADSNLNICGLTRFIVIFRAGNSLVGARVTMKATQLQKQKWVYFSCLQFSFQPAF